jgi:hypothetical protein
MCNCKGVLKSGGSCGCQNCPQGDPGAPGTDGLSAYEVWIEEGNTGTEQDFLDSLVGPQGEPGAPCVECDDTGWHDLEGFDFYTGIPKPQARKLGSQIHFRGDVIIPLEQTTNVPIPIVDNDTYTFIAKGTPYQGVGGVTLDTDFRLIFNNDSNVIPTNVLPLATNIDGIYTNPNKFASRKISIDELGAGGTFSVITLDSFFKVEITQDKKLVIYAVDALEKSNIDTGAFGFTGASPLRKSISSFIGRSLPIDYSRIDTNVGDRDAMTSILGEGILVNESLIQSQAYRILDFAAGDDFTVSGALLNTAGAVFIANGTPPVWSNGSRIVRILNEGYVGFDHSAYGNPFYPLIVDTATNSIDAAKHNEIGAFRINIDGLIAYV